MYVVGYTAGFTFSPSLYRGPFPRTVQFFPLQEWHGLWAGPCELIWPIEKDRNDGVSVLTLVFRGLGCFHSPPMLLPS